MIRRSHSFHLRGSAHMRNCRFAPEGTREPPACKHIDKYRYFSRRWRDDPNPVQYGLLHCCSIVTILLVTTRLLGPGTGHPMCDEKKNRTKDPRRKHAGAHQLHSFAPVCDLKVAIARVTLARTKLATFNKLDLGALPALPRV